MSDSFEALKEELAQLEGQGLRRTCRGVEAVEGGRIRIDGQWKIHLASNNYLGLTLHPRVIAAAREALERFGAGAGSARLIGGTFPPHEALEEELAQFKQAEAAVVFPAGYMTSLGVVAALVGPEDLVIGDRFNHASLIDAARLSGAVLRVYPHKNVERLEEALRQRRTRYRRVLVVTEGLFSMDGDVPPLREIAEVARRYEAWLLVDDAHATGVLGPTGRGSLEQFGLPTGDLLQMGTLSKALGSAGGFLAGPRVVIETLIHRARPFLYTTALPPSCAAAAHAALRVLQEEPVWRQRLWENTRRWIAGLKRVEVELLSEESPLVPVRVSATNRGGSAKICGGGSSNNREVVALARALFEAGLFAPAIRPPTVPEGTARIRTSVTALHAPEDLETALEAMSSILGREVHGKP